MKLEIPFYEQESGEDCGPTSLKMVLEYFEEEHSIEQLKGLVDSEKIGTTWTLGLAKAAAELGFKTEFYTTCLGMNPANFELSFYQEKANKLKSEDKVERLKTESHKLGVKMEEKSLGLKELLSKTSTNCIPIILLDWNVLRDKEDYQGHFVPIVGYDEENVYVHNPGKNNATKFMAIKRDLFEKARKSKGTDEDIVYIHRKIDNTKL